MALVFLKAGTQPSTIDKIMRFKNLRHLLLAAKNWFVSWSLSRNPFSRCRTERSWHSPFAWASKDAARKTLCVFSKGTRNMLGNSSMRRVPFWGSRVEALGTLSHAPCHNGQEPRSSARRTCACQALGPSCLCHFQLKLLRM